MNTKIKHIILSCIFLLFAFGIYYINSGKSNKYETIDEIKEQSIDILENEVVTEDNNKKEQSQKTIKATKKYYCYDESKLEGNKCVTTLTVDALVKTYYCKEGNVVGSQCNLSGYVYYTPPTTYGDNSEINNFQLNCSVSGGLYEYKDNIWKCKKYEIKYVDAVPSEYYCTPNYELVGKKCVFKTSYNAAYNYVCPSGYTLQELNCIKK